jgi:hypothetical protein
MRSYLSTFICVLLIVCLLGCKEMRSPPAGVPSSAVWADNAFVDCSIETQSDANRCTVYSDRGQILADGLFVLNSSHSAAEKSELRYIGFGERGIYLEDLRILEQRTATQRDPSHRVIDNRLKILASKGGLEPADCNANAAGATDVDTECALKAFAAKRPFYLRYYWQDAYSWGYRGIAGDADGNVYEAWYHYGPVSAVRIGDSGGPVLPCPKPTILSKTKDGKLTCARPIA